MKLSVFLEHVVEAAQTNNETLEQELEYVKQTGIQALEVSYDYVQKNPEVYSLIQKSGLKISCVHKDYALNREDQKEALKAHIDFAAEAGALRILVVPGFLDKDEAVLFDGLKNYDKAKKIISQLDAFEVIKNQLAFAVEYAAKKNVRVALEDYDNFTSPCAHLLQLKWFMEQVPGLGFALDTGNFAYSNEDVVEAYENLKNKIVHVHLKDRGKEPASNLLYNKGLVPCAVGQGYIPIQLLVEKICKETDYDSYFAIEHFGAPDQKLFIKESADFLRNL